MSNAEKVEANDSKNSSTEGITKHSSTAWLFYLVIIICILFGLINLIKSTKNYQEVPVGQSQQSSQNNIEVS